MHKTVEDNNNVKMPLYMRMYLLNLVDTDGDHITRELSTRLVYTSYVEDKDISSIDILSLLDYKLWDNPNNYTCLVELISEFSKAEISRHFGLSITEFLDLDFYTIDVLLKTAKVDNEKEKESREVEQTKLEEMMKGMFNGYT